ncbi:MAG TPA: hypothetical protein VG276_07825, partial [Actinomycetes bacterium]|nr:hypothetical protein [Actinomycetes bacterium]
MTWALRVATDCVDTAFLPDGTLDELPLPARIGRARVGGIDLNTPPIRAALAAVLALAAAPGGLHRRRPRPPRWEATAGQTGSTIRQAADDLPTLRGQGPDRQTRPVAALPGPPTSRPHHRRPAHPPRPGHRPILAGARSPDAAANPPTGPPSTQTTRPSASACRPASSTSASPPAVPRHRQP